MATVNKTRPSCAKVKVQMDIMDDLSKYVEIEIMNSIMNEVRVEKVKIQYDLLPKYCRKYMLQGHNKQKCRILHPELNKNYVDNEELDESL